MDTIRAIVFQDGSPWRIQTWTIIIRRYQQISSHYDCASVLTPWMSGCVVRQDGNYTYNSLLILTLQNFHLTTRPRVLMKKYFLHEICCYL